jgi:hypothetical protein
MREAKATIRARVAQEASGPSGQIIRRFEEAARGEKGPSLLQAAKMDRRYGLFTPTVGQAEEASKFREKIQPHVVTVLMKGTTMQTTAEMVAADVSMRWRPKTQADKERAAQSFRAFLTAVGLMDTVFPASGGTPDKTTVQRGIEEDALTGLALNRAMAGQGLPGILNTISHVRTWYEHQYGATLGMAKRADTSSPTSKYIKSMGIYFPVKDSTCKKRAPMTTKLVQLMTTAARTTDHDAGTAILVAFAALFRMGEITATEGGFDPVEDMTEDDATFYPNFWSATCVEVKLGRSKADQDGKRAKLRPRILPVDDDPLSPGRAIQTMLAERYRLRRGQPLMIVTGRPLFQDGRQGQLKQSAVLTFMRKTLMKQGGMSQTEANQYGTHSCRIGGATRLFELGATPDVFKHLGGWSSEAYRGYVVIQQKELMTFARNMFR